VVRAVIACTGLFGTNCIISRFLCQL